MPNVNVLNVYSMDVYSIPNSTTWLYYILFQTSPHGFVYFIPFQTAPHGYVYFRKEHMALFTYYNEISLQVSMEHLSYCLSGRVVAGSTRVKGSTQGHGSPLDDP